MVTAGAGGSWAHDTKQSRLRYSSLAVATATPAGGAFAVRPAGHRYPTLSLPPHHSKTHPRKTPAAKPRKRPPGATFPVSFWCQPEGAGNTGPSPMLRTAKTRQKDVRDLVVLSYCLIVLVNCIGL